MSTGKPSLVSSLSRRRLARRWLLYLAALELALVAMLWALPANSAGERLSANPSRLRNIWRASLNFADEHGGRFPVAVDIHDYARQLARDGGLDDAATWLVEGDPAAADQPAQFTTVLAAGGDSLEPAFVQLHSGWAVVASGLSVDLPATTPVAWTRGLGADGTWASHAPYGDDGGLVIFLDGSERWYRDFRAQGDQMLRFDGTGSTSDIHEALPPGTLVAEYLPTATEAAAWTKANHRRQRAEAIARRLRDPMLRTVLRGALICNLGLLVWLIRRSTL